MSDHGHGDDASDQPEGLSESEKRAGEEHGRDVDTLERVTAPMQSYGMREVGVGFVVLVVGVVLTFGLPLLLT